MKSAPSEGRLDQILAKIDSALAGWARVRDTYNLTDELVTEGNRIINAERRKKAQEK